MSPVSAWASKWIIEIRPWPSTLATPLASGKVDRVVAAEDDRDGSRTGDLLDRGLEGRQGDLDVTGVHLHVAGVDHREVDQAVGAQRQARPGPVVGQVVPHPDRHRPEAGSRAGRGAAVEGCPEDDDLRVGVRRRVVEVAHRDAEEGEVGAELLAVAGHARSLAPARGCQACRACAESGADGAEGPEGVDQVGAVLRLWPRGELHADRAGRRVDVDHLAVDAEAHQRVAARAGDEPELVAVPAAGEHLLVVGARERLRVRRAAGAARRRATTPGPPRVPSTSPSSSSSWPNRARSRAVADMPPSWMAEPTAVAGDVGVVLGADRDPEQARDEVGHPACRSRARRPSRACRCRPSGR